MQRFIFINLAVMLSAAPTAIAAAQTISDQGTAAARNSAPVADTDSENGLEDIVVTAQRREENLQHAAIAVSAITGDKLAAAGISETANLTRLVPSLVVQPLGGSSLSLYLRGVGTRGGNSFAENPVSFNFAGVYIARPTAPVGTFYDLERIEVLKGPQGTLYGRNSTGGAVNVLPKAPKLGTFSGDATLEYGNYDSKKAVAALNIPLGSKAALRVAGQIVDRDGYLSNGSDDDKGQAARASLLMRPSDRFSVTVIGDYFRQRGKGLGAVLVPDALAPDAPPVSRRIEGSDPRSTNALLQNFGFLIGSGLVKVPQDDAFQRSEFYGLAGVAEADLGFAKLTVIPAYRKSKPDYLSYLSGFSGRVTEDNDQYSLEARLASKGDGPLSYVLGAYYFDEKQRAVNLYDVGLITYVQILPRLKTSSKAVFGQASYAVTDGFRLVGGLRYTDESRKDHSSIRVLTPTDQDPPFAVANNSLTSRRVTWKAGLEYDAGPNSLVYANVATGFKAGGFFPAASDNAFAPEALRAYTLGSKNRFLDNRLQLNVEIFYWKYKNQQVSYLGPVLVAPGLYGPGNLIDNIGQSRMYGAEADLVFAPDRDDNFEVNIQYLNSKYNSLTYSGLSGSGAPLRTSCATTLDNSFNAIPPGVVFEVSCGGKPAVNAPKISVNLAYDHTFRLGDYRLVAGVRSRIESSRYLSLEFNDVQRQKGYMTSDAILTLNAPDDRWSISAFVNNIEDKVLYAGSTLQPILNTAYNSLRPPRTYGVRTSVHF